MKKRFLARALVVALGISLAIGNTSLVVTNAQENQTESVTSDLNQDEVTMNQAGGAITEETILEWTSGDGTYSLKYQFRTVDGDLEVVIKGYGSKYKDTIVIPSTISAPAGYSNSSSYQNVPVRSIDQNAFRADTCPVSVTIPASVESIGTNAFTNGDSTSGAILQTVTFEAGTKLNYIGDYAFQNQKQLAIDLVIPEGVTYIGLNAFEGCENITSVKFNGAGTISEKAFYNCKKAAGGIDLSCGVTTIGDNAFANFGSSLTDAPGQLKLPEGLTTIGKSAFSGANLKGNLVIPASVTTMGESAFSKAYTKDTDKGTLTFAGTSKLTAIPNSAFNGCKGFNGNLVIPNSVTSIGNTAFQDCSGFDGTLTLSSKLTSIGQSTFSGCEGFNGNLTIPGTVTTVGKAAFMDCSGFDGNLTISSKITTIPDNTFKNCSKLEGSLTLPTNLVSLGTGAFYECESLTGALKIPSKVTSIPKEAFTNCIGFTSLSMPNGITSIGDSAFSGCSNLAGKFTLPTSLKTIGKEAFLNCSDFTGNLDMPDTVTTVGQSAFMNMTGLDGYLYISKNATSYGMNAFKNCSGLKNQDDATGKDILIVVPEGTKELTQDMFYGCEGLTSIKIPTSITKINSSTFARTNNALDVYVYSGSGAASAIRDISANGATFDIIYIDWLFKIVPTTTDMYIRVGGSRKLTADLHYYKYNETTGKDEEVVISEAEADVDLVWTSSNTATAKYENGKVYGLKTGTPTVTVSEPNTGVGAKCTVRVVASYVSKVTLDSTTKVYFDTSDEDTEDVITANITFKGLDQAIASGELTKEDIVVEWTQTKADTVKIIPGTVTISDDYTTATAKATVKAKNSGLTTVKATVSFKGDTKSVTSSGKAYETFVPLESISIKENLTGKVGSYYTLGVTYNPSNATNQKVSWKTSDSSVAKVSSAGKVTFRGEGTCIITCTPTVEDGDTAEPVECKVTVYPKDSSVVTDSDTSSGDSGSTGGSDDSDDSDDEDDVDVANLPKINVSYRTHIQSFGWEADENQISKWKKNGDMSGTSGKAKRLEGINIVVNSAESGKSADLGIQYTTHCQSYGWLPWSSNGDMNGTEGEAKRLEAIMIRLTGADADKYDVYYRVHAQSYGWLDWAKNGEPSGTAGYGKRLEGIQIVVVKKGESFNENMGGIKSVKTDAYVAKSGSSPIVNHSATSNTKPVIPGMSDSNIAYRTHVQKYGWQGWKYNGQMSGTSGEAKRLEGIEIKLTNQQYEGSIVYTTHVQKYGWQGKVDDPSTWVKEGGMSGTSGEAKRLEAICIKLTGEMAEHYDIYYRVHAQTFGWLGWAKNGEESGTAGYAKRLEGIQIVLVPKGGSEPAKNYGGITSKDARPYIEK